MLIRQIKKRWRKATCPRETATFEKRNLKETIRTHRPRDPRPSGRKKRGTKKKKETWVKEVELLLGRGRQKEYGKVK